MQRLEGSCAVRDIYITLVVLRVNSEVPFCMLAISSYAVVLESKYSKLVILKPAIWRDPVLVLSTS